MNNFHIRLLAISIVLSIFAIVSCNKKDNDNEGGVVSKNELIPLIEGTHI